MNITEERRARESSTSEESSEIGEMLTHRFEVVRFLIAG
jgi:hypothetical protein